MQCIGRNHGAAGMGVIFNEKMHWKCVMKFVPVGFVLNKINFEYLSRRSFVISRIRVQRTGSRDLLIVGVLNEYLVGRPAKTRSETRPVPLATGSLKRPLSRRRESIVAKRVVRNKSNQNATLEQ